MTQPLRYTSYRVSRSLFWVVAATGTFGLATVLIPAASGPLLVGPAVAVFVLFLVRVRNLATSTTPDHLVLRQLVRTERIPWREVQELRVEPNPGAAFNNRAPAQVAVLYDASGRSRVLANVNDTNLGGGGAQLLAEVDKIRRIWLAQRGSDWRPAAAALRTAAYQERYGAGAWHVGLMGALIALPVTVVALLAGIIGGASDSGPSWLFAPWMVLVVPLLTFLAVTLLTARRRRGT